MKRLYILSFICISCLFTAATCQAQIVEIGYGPVSNRGIGALPNTSRFDVSLLFKAYTTPVFHYIPGIRYTRVHSKNKVLRDDHGVHINGKFNMLFLIPAAFDFPVSKWDILVRLGFGFCDKHFPNKNGFAENFLLEAGLKYPITSLFSVSLRYSHISNAGLGDFNPGVDNIEIAVGFSF